MTGPFYVTVVGDLPGIPAVGSTPPEVTFTPAGWLPDPANSMLFPPNPQAVRIFGGTFSVALLATDTTGTSWTWEAIFSGIPGVSTYSFSFALPSNAEAFTATDASPCVFTASGTAYSAGQQVTLAGTSLPGGFTAGTVYYVVSPSGDAFSLAATPGGTALASTSTGSGWVVPVVDISTLATIPSIAPTNQYVPYPDGQPAVGDVPTVTQASPLVLDWATPDSVSGVTSFNGRTGAVTPESGDYSVGQVTGAAPLASPALTGTPTAPTQGAGDDSTKIATTAYADTSAANAEAAAKSASLPSTDDLSAIASANATAGNVAMNSHKLTGLADGSASTDSAAFGQTPAGGNTATIGQGGTGQTTQQAAINALTGTQSAGTYLRSDGTNASLHAIEAADVPTLNQNTTGTASNITDTLDQVPAPAANVSLNSHKVTNLANGTASSDAAAFGQIPTSLPPDGSAGGDLSGAVTSADAALVADLNNATARTATATLLAGEETVFSGSTAGQTLTLPASPPSSSVNTITNAASVSVTLAPGSGQTLSNFGTTGNITIPAGYTFAVVYIGTTWYVQSAGPSDFAKNNALAIANGGTGQTTQQAAINSLAGAVTSGDYLRGNGSNVQMSAIQAADLPAATTSTQGAVQLDGTASDIQAVGQSAAAGSSGEAADAKHVHQGVTSLAAGSGVSITGGDGSGHGALTVSASGGSGNYGGLFGDGSDGSVTLDGSTTYNSFSSLAGSTYTLTRDVFASSLTIDSGVTLQTANYRIFCTGTVTNGGTVDNSGASATSSSGASGSTAAIFLNSPGAGNGGATTGSTPSAAGNGAVGGGNTGTGGSGSSGSGGSGGNPTMNSSFNYLWKTPTVIISGLIRAKNSGQPFVPAGTVSGSGGGGDGTNKGGGGGCGGNVIAICAHALVNNGTISSNGGNGFTPTVGNCGGGAGGGGGIIVTYTLSSPTGSGSTSVAGGTGGSGVGTGTAGANGGTGSVVNVIVQ
jgi:hypothetical protein